MISERVPPDINVAMAMLATRLRIPISTSLEIYFRSLRCLVGTHGDDFDTSVDNLHETDWYKDAPMMMLSDFEWYTYGLMETELFCLIDPITAMRNLGLWSTIMICLVDDNNSNMRFFWMQLFVRAMEYDPRRMILYRNLQTTIRLSYEECEW